jgi:hypothetical protein
MGYSNVNAQLLTVPVYLSAALVFLVTARLSERWKVRGYFVIFNLVTMMIGKSLHVLKRAVANGAKASGNIILATTSGVAPRYFAVFLIASGRCCNPLAASGVANDTQGIYSGPGLNISWVAGNVANHYKRSAAFGLNQLMGNSAGAA